MPLAWEVVFTGVIKSIRILKLWYLWDDLSGPQNQMTSALIRDTQRRQCEDAAEREMATIPQAKGMPTAARGSKIPGRDTPQRLRRVYRPADFLITDIWPPEKVERISF